LNGWELRKLHSQELRKGLARKSSYA